MRDEGGIKRPVENELPDRDGGKRIKKKKKIKRQKSQSRF